MTMNGKSQYKMLANEIQQDSKRTTCHNQNLSVDWNSVDGFYFRNKTSHGHLNQYEKKFDKTQNIYFFEVGSHCVAQTDL